MTGDDLSQVPLTVTLRRAFWGDEVEGCPVAETSELFPVRHFWTRLQHRNANKCKRAINVESHPLMIYISCEIVRGN